MAPVKEFKESFIQQIMLKNAGELASVSSYDLAKEAKLVEDFSSQDPKADTIPEPIALAIQNELDAIEAEGLDYVLPDIVNNAKGLKTAAQIFGDAVAIYIGNDKVEEPVPPAPACPENCTFSWADTNPTSFDLAHLDDTYSMQIGLQQFEGLLTTAIGDGPPEPGVASHYAVSEDGLRYTFYLRRDAKWSNGRTVVADDFVYSWRRVLDPSTGSEASANLTMLKNADLFLTGKLKDFSAVGVRAIGEHILEVELKFPVPQFPSVVCHSSFTPVPREVVEKYGVKWTEPANIVVNGPYKLSEFKNNDRTILVKNENYWNADAVQIKAIKIIHASDANTQLRLHQAGQTDWITRLPSTQIRELSQSKEYREDPTMAVYEYAFKMDKAPLDNPLIRGALELAVDREMLVRQVIPGLGETANSFMLSVFQKSHGYEPPVFPSFNPNEARRLLARAGFPDGKGFPEITLSTIASDAFNSKAIAEFIQREWKENLGINVEIGVSDFGDLLGNLRNGNFQISRETYAAPYPYDIKMFERFTKGDPDNFHQYDNPEYDALISRAKRETDQGLRNQLLKQAEEILDRDKPSIPLFYPKRTYLVRKGISGFEPNMTQKHLVKYIRRE